MKSGSERCALPTAARARPTRAKPRRTSSGPREDPICGFCVFRGGWGRLDIETGCASWVLGFWRRLVKQSQRIDGPVRIRIGRDACNAIVIPAGFDWKGLLFALDHAYFLQRLGDTDGALRLLLEAAAEMDMDRNPPVPWREPLTAGEPAPYPERVESRARRTLWRASAGISRKEFLRLVDGEFALAGQPDRFGRFFEGRIAAGENFPSPVGCPPAFVGVADASEIVTSLSLAEPRGDAGR